MPETLGPSDVRPWSEPSLAGRLQLPWHRATLATQFIIAAAVVIIILMTLLAYWMNRRIETSVIRGAADSASIYIESFLEPIVQDLPPSGKLTPAARRKLDALMRDPLFRRHIETLKIWATDGTLLYSENSALEGQRFPSNAVEQAAAGNIVSSLEYGQGAAYRRGEGLSYPLIEIYVPLHRDESADVAAVGEVYESAGVLKAELAKARLATTGIVCALTLSMLALLYLIVRRGSITIETQAAALESRYAEASALAEQNERLRQSADQARLYANRATEDLLSRIGADLHDGPVQLVSLLMLKLDAIAHPNHDRRRLSRELTQLTSDVLIDLRNLSAGLVLPELKDLSVEETVRRAVDRHKNLTGSEVDCAITGPPAEVPHATKICIYRVIQEALNNAYHHAHGRDQTVRVKMGKNTVAIRVRDGGDGFEPEAVQNGGRAKLGLPGLKNRVEALNGTIRLRSASGAGTELHVELPIAPGAT